MLKSSPLVFILTLGLLFPVTGFAETGKPVKVIEPKNKVTPVKSAAIDTERFQLGAFVGLLAVEDFNNNLSYGLSLSYQISSNYIAQINYATSTVNKASFEGSLDFLSSADRNLNYYNIAAGYKLFPARTFVGSKRKYDTDIYLLAGIGSVDFAGSSSTSLMFGASYRIVVTDWLVWSIDMRDHIFEREFLDDKKMTQNIEFVSGLNLLF